MAWLGPISINNEQEIGNCQECIIEADN